MGNSASNVVENVGKTIATPFFWAFDTVSMPICLMAGKTPRCTTEEMWENKLKSIELDDFKRAFKNIGKATENVTKVAATPFTAICDGANALACEALGLKPRYITDEMWEADFFKDDRTYAGISISTVTSW